ncbi:hypothetical protein KAV47_01860 [Candidatus Bathyarchaeota archaeon]|nr:hypothetical protein [Candidatus Bathyarchaeota archaeon]
MNRGCPLVEPDNHENQTKKTSQRNTPTATSSRLDGDLPMADRATSPNRVDQVTLE